MLKAPFVYFGGKTKVAPRIWSLLGNVDTYIEPFCGSAVVLLSRPHRPKVETINDRNSMVVNFWRATQQDPEGVVAYADGPETEIDMLARHRFMTQSSEAVVFRDKLKRDPEYFNAKFAGWWVWGMCCWIGKGWCDESSDAQKKIPRLGAGVGFQGKVPAHFHPTQGVCERRREWVLLWFKKLRDRLRHVRVGCGDWQRVCDSPTAMGSGTTGIFLDPPYRLSTAGGDTRVETYDSDGGDQVNQVVDAVISFCKERGSQRGVRIVACSYAGEGYEALLDLGWKEIRWKSGGGYDNRDGVNANGARERLWASPHCLSPADHGFDIAYS